MAGGVRSVELCQVAVRSGRSGTAGMKSDIIHGTIQKYDPETGEVTITAKYDAWELFLKRNYKDVLVQMVDSRPISDKQRKACYALLHEISEWSGNSLEATKTVFKIQFLTERYETLGNTIFSLSNAPMSIVSGFQQLLIDFCLEYDVPTKRPLVQYVNDIEAYLYSCVIHKKCCICGQHADLHHVNPIGMGANRKTMIHEGLEVMPLCRIHHTEMHQYTREKFFEMYHFDHGIPADKKICKLYGLKMYKDEID